MHMGGMHASWVGWGGAQESKWRGGLYAGGGHKRPPGPQPFFSVAFFAEILGPLCQAL